MDACLLHLFKTFQPRDDMLDVLVEDMKRREPELFESFVNYCERRRKQWKHQIGYLRTAERQLIQPADCVHYVPVNGCRDEVVEQCRGLRVLLSSTQAPAHGGAATNAYKLLSFLRASGVENVACIFQENLNFNGTNRIDYDPDGAGGVWRTPRFLEIAKYKEQHIRSQLRRDVRRVVTAVERFLGGKPDVILCKNYVSPLESRYLYPDVPVVYLVSGSAHVTRKKTTALEVLQLDPDELMKLVPQEVKACESSALILPNSSISHTVFSHVYGGKFADRISAPINTSNIEKIDLSRKIFLEDWSRRKFDVGFVVSGLGRNIKGPHIASEVFSHPRMSVLRKIVVGDEQGRSELFKARDDLVRRERLDHAGCIQVLRDCRVVIMPSLFDASPNLLNECISNGCVPVCTRNVGNTELLDTRLVVDDLYDVDQWVEAVTSLLKDPVLSCYRADAQVTDLDHALLDCILDVVN